MCGATKSPLVLGLGKSTWESNLPNCGRMLLQKWDVELRKSVKSPWEENDVTKLPKRKDGGTRNCQDSLERAEEFQAKEAHLTCRLLTQYFSYNRGSLAGDKAGGGRRGGGNGEMNCLIRPENVS